MNEGPAPKYEDLDEQQRLVHDKATLNEGEFPTTRVGRKVDQDKAEAMAYAGDVSETIAARMRQAGMPGSEKLDRLAEISENAAAVTHDKIQEMISGKVTEYLMLIQEKAITQAGNITVSQRGETGLKIVQKIDQILGVKPESGTEEERGTMYGTSFPRIQKIVSSEGSVFYSVDDEIPIAQPQ